MKTLRIPRSSWTPVCCSCFGDKAAVRSYFSGFAAGCEVLKADMLEDNRSNRMLKIRALVRNPHGHLREIVRTFGRKTFVINMRPPSRGILKGWKEPAPAAEATHG